MKLVKVSKERYRELVEFGLSLQEEFNKKMIDRNLKIYEVLFVFSVVVYEMCHLIDNSAKDSKGSTLLNITMMVKELELLFDKDEEPENKEGN